MINKAIVQFLFVAVFIIILLIIIIIIIQGVWPDSGDDKNYTKEFAAITIDCLKPPDKRAKLTDVCKRLEVMDKLHNLLLLIIYHHVKINLI